MALKQRAKNLEDLLNAVERGNKQDAHDFTRGHLNEANLKRPQEFRTHKGWDGAKSSTLAPGNRSKIPQSVRRKGAEKGMTDVLSQFVLGTDNFLPTVKKSKLRKQKQSDWPADSTGSIDEQALVEELDSRRFMLNRSQPTRLLRTWALEDDENRTEQSRSVPPRHGFYSLRSGATKQDQYEDFKTFEQGTLHKQDIFNRKALAGDQTAKRVEEKLNRKLMILGPGPGTAFHRLQAHSDTLQELLEASPLFSSALQQIKTEYDEYVSWLLDTQPSQSHVLRDQVNDLYDRRVSNPKQLNQARRDTNRLEEEGKKLLELNDKLRDEVKRQRDRASKKVIPDSYNSHQPHNREDKSHFDLADQLEDLHATIMERLDKLDDMRAQLRNEYVPSNVCQNLEQCLKDTEIEIQKLLKQNEIMEKGIEDMEIGISKAVDECDVSTRDKQKCWEKVNKVYIPGIKRDFTTYQSFDRFMDVNKNDLPTNLHDPYLEGTSSGEEDERQTDKWDWYIS